MNLQWQLIWEAREPLLQGTLITLQVAFGGLLIALVLGLIVALLRMSALKAVSIPAFLYTQFFRGVSLYVLVLWAFFGLPIITKVSLPPLTTAIVALGLLNSAYMSEIYRGAFKVVGQGQRDAAHAVGMTGTQTLLFIVIPQALRVFIPSAANLFVDMLKDAAIVGVVGVFDLMRTADRLTRFYFRPFEFYTATAIIYFVLVFIFARLVVLLEKRFSRHVQTTR